MKRVIRHLLAIAYAVSMACGVNWVLFGYRVIDNVMVPVRTTAACGGWWFLWFLCFMFEAWWNDRIPFKELS